MKRLVLQYCSGKASMLRPYGGFSRRGVHRGQLGSGSNLSPLCRRCSTSVVPSAQSPAPAAAGTTPWGGVPRVAPGACIWRHSLFGYPAPRGGPAAEQDVACVQWPLNDLRSRDPIDETAAANPVARWRSQERRYAGRSCALVQQNDSLHLPVPEGVHTVAFMNVRRVTIRGWLEDRVEGQIWYYRLPVVLMLLWFLNGYMTEWHYESIFYGMNLGFHEAGHAAFMWSGNRMLTIAGGTIFELAIPLVAGAYLLVRQRDPFGATVCTFWFGTALVGSGIYAADALDQALPLVSPFGPVDAGSHDWTSMLMRVGKLSRAEEIGGSMQAAGKVMMVASIAAGSGILWLMARPRASSTPTALWDSAEEARLAAHLRGEKVRREHDERRRKRMTEEDRLREFLDS